MKALEPLIWSIGGYKLPDMGAGNRTGVLCNSSKSSLVQRHLSSPLLV